MKNNKKLFVYIMLIAVETVLFLYLLGTALLLKREKAINLIEDNNETTVEVVTDSKKSESEKEIKLEEGDLYVDAITFPDADLRKLILNSYEISDDILRKEVIQFIDTLDIRGMEIADLKGIEYFTNLRNMECDYSQLGVKGLSVVENVVAHYSVPEKEALDYKLLDISGIPDWKTAIEGKRVNYVDKSGVEQIYELEDDRFLIPEDSSKLFCKYQLKSGKKITLELEPEIAENESLVDVVYRSAVQGLGWMKPVFGGELSGTTEQEKRLEAMMIEVVGDKDLEVEYSLLCETKGWMTSSKNGEMNGTEGESLRAEAIRIWLTGAHAEKYEIYYRVHVEDYGWLGWAKNGEEAGTLNLFRRIEAIQIILVEAGKAIQDDFYGIKCDTSERMITQELLERQEADRRFQETVELINNYGFSDFSSSVLRNGKEWEDLYLPKASVLSFKLNFETAKDCGDYYEIDCIISKTVKITEELEPGYDLFVTTNELTGEGQSYIILLNGNLKEMSGSRQERPNPKDHHGEILEESDNPLTCVIATGLVRVYHNVLVPAALNYTDKTVDEFVEEGESIFRSHMYKPVVFDDNGYITFLFYKGK